MGCTRADSFVYLPGNDLIREMKYHTEKNIYIGDKSTVFVSKETKSTK